MISQNDIVACVIVGIMMLLMLGISAVLLMGKGSWLIAGYNTLDKKEKAKYDSAALCKFVGKYLLSVSLLMPAIPIGGIFKLHWLIAAYICFMLISAFCVIVYCNTGDRFKK